MGLQVLVNREGFLPDAAYFRLVELIQYGIDFTTRLRAAASAREREHRRNKKEQRTADSTSRVSIPPLHVLSTEIARLSTSALEARRLIAGRDFAGVDRVLKDTEDASTAISEAAQRLATEGGWFRVTASLGAQLAGFLHEIKAAVGSAQELDRALAKLREDPNVAPTIRRRLAVIHRLAVDARQSLERQASFLIDVVAPDARRRKSRQPLAERFETARKLVKTAAARRAIRITNDIPTDLKSPAMFPAEVTAIFTNLLTNAVKAAGQGGVIRASGRSETGSGAIIRIENSGDSVNLLEAERWFRPFESTTERVDVVLGQGMGLGLTLTRSMLEEYGAEIQFVKPNNRFATAIEIQFPK